MTARETGEWRNRLREIASTRHYVGLARKASSFGEQVKPANLHTFVSGMRPVQKSGKVGAGTHSIKLRSGNGQTKSASVKVKAGGQTAYCWDFTHNATCQ